MPRQAPTFDAIARARRGVMDMKAYIPGRHMREVREAHGLDKVTKLASNECPLPLPESVVQSLVARPEELSRYPDGHCAELRRALAKESGLPEDCFLFGNGAEECIRLIAQAFIDPTDTALMPDPIFDAYETATLMCGGSLLKAPLKDWVIDLDGLAELVDERTKIVWLCNPANPMGTIFGRQVFEAFLERLPDGVLVVLDGAYIEFVDEDKAEDLATAERYLLDDPRVVGIRTFSKAYGLAGLRVGYIQAHPSVIEVVKQVKLPFNVSAPAQFAALAALGEQDFMRGHVAMIREQREFMAQALSERQMVVIPSQTNFLLAHTPIKARSIFESLLPKGYIVRPAGILDSEFFLRVSIGTRQENLGLLDALDQVLGEAALGGYGRQPA